MMIDTLINICNWFSIVGLLIYTYFMIKRGDEMQTQIDELTKSVNYLVTKDIEDAKNL